MWRRVASRGPVSLPLLGVVAVTVIPCLALLAWSIALLVADHRSHIDSLPDKPAAMLRSSSAASRARTHRTQHGRAPQGRHCGHSESHRREMTPLMTKGGPFLAATPGPIKLANDNGR